MTKYFSFQYKVFAFPCIVNILLLYIEAHTGTACNVYRKISPNERFSLPPPSQSTQFLSVCAYLSHSPNITVILYLCALQPTRISAKAGCEFLEFKRTLIFLVRRSPFLNFYDL
jgi:hypothetical protein